MVKQISDNGIYLLIKYIKSILWRVAKRLSYIEDARCLKVNKLKYECFSVQAVGPVLRIISALVRDRGVYICTAENTAGSAVASAVVEVERKWLEFSV